MSTIYNNKSTNYYTTGSDSPDDFSDIWDSSNKNFEQITKTSRIAAFYYEGVTPVEFNQSYTVLHPHSNSDLEINVEEGHGSDSMDPSPVSESDNEKSHAVEHNSDHEVLEPIIEHSTPSCFSRFLSALRSFIVSLLIKSDKMNPFVHNR